jgi:Tol biopolymer transport system component
MPRRITGALACGLTIAAALGASLPAWGQGTTKRVSVGPNGRQSNDISWGPVLSADGRFAAFASKATNLVPGDTNNETDVFVRDRRTGKTERASVGPNGIQGNSPPWSFSPGSSALSADGRFVAFGSDATNLVPGDTNGEADVFVHDRRTRKTERVSVGPGGGQGNDWSSSPTLSADGRFVAFYAEATNLVPGDTNNQWDVFVRDRRTGKTERVSLGPSGVQSNGSNYAPVLSADGRFVAFYSDASNLVPGDTNGEADVFVHDRRTGKTERVSVGPGGGQGNGESFSPSLSADGRFVAFQSYATNLVPGDTNNTSDVFVRDRGTGTTERVSVGPGGVQADGTSFDTELSADGRFVAFASDASNLVSDDTNGMNDVFVHDRQTRKTERVSVGQRSVQGNRGSIDPALSADGRVAAFYSSADNLVQGDTNSEADVFVHTR